MQKTKTAFDLSTREGSVVSELKADNMPRSVSIVDTLAIEIGHGILMPGAHLEEEVLCHRFSASRTPIREALRQLAARGLIEIKPRQGAFVIQLDADRVVEMFEVMGYLEAACSSLAAKRHNSQDRIALTDAHQQCIVAAQQNNPESFYQANAHFHECIYRASHNCHLEEQTLALRNRLELYRRDVTFHAGLMAISVNQHEKVLQAILEMNQEGASEFMSQHLDTLSGDAVSMASMAYRRSGRVNAR